MEKYEEYQESGENWIGAVPVDWTVGRLGGYFSERRTKVSDTNYEPLSVTKQGIVPRLENAAKTNDGDNRKLVRAGDFVVNSRSDRKGSSGIAFQDGSVSLINTVLEPKGIAPLFINYLLKSYAFIEEFYRNGHGIVADLWTTRFQEMKNIKIAVPPPEEQEQIVAFLESVLIPINTAITNQQKLITLLQERKQIIIQRAVTRGLDAGVEMKDSGVEWMSSAAASGGGEVPGHWEVKKLKYILDERKERSEEGTEPLLMVSQVHGLVVRSDYHDKAEVAASNIGNKVVYENDLVFNKLKAHLGVFFKSTIKQPGIVSPDYAVYYSKGAIKELKFLELLFRHPSYIGQFIIRATGIVEGLIRLYTGDLFDIEVAVPPYEEQLEILNYINRMSVKIDRAIHLQTQQVEKLKEYKTVLIDAAVTGKVKVLG